MTDHLTITDRVFISTDAEVQSFLDAIRRATEFHTEDALLADMLDHLIAFRLGDDEGKASVADYVRDSAYKLQDYADALEAEAEHPYGDGIKRRVEE